MRGIYDPLIMLHHVRKQLSPGGRTGLHVGLAMALCAFVLAWVATSPRFLALINWDNAAYVGAYTTGRLTWSSMPWDAHFAIGHIYLLGVALARGLGGTAIDGFRLTEATFFAAAAMLLGMVCFALVQKRLLAGLLTLAWMTAWVNMHLLFTLEDNILYLAPGAGVIWLSAKHVGAWRRAHSLGCGALAAMALLISWQAVLYLGPPIYAALIGGPRQRSVWQRATAAAWVIAAFVAGLVGWCLLLAATSTLPAKDLLRVLFRRPDTLGTPELVPLLIVGRLGVAMAFLLSHSAVWVPKPPLPFAVLGVVTLAVMAALFIGTTWWSLRLRDYKMHVLTASMLLFALLTPTRHDVAYAYLKRFDFLPIMLVLLIASALSHVPSLRARRLTAAALALITMIQGTLAVRWEHRYLAFYPALPAYSTLPHPERSWYGREGRSFFGYYRRLRQTTPQACRHVFALIELWEGSWNFDIPASLWSELPDHLAIGDADLVKTWRFPPRTVTLEQFYEQQIDKPCNWYSEHARLLLRR